MAKKNWIQEAVNPKHVGFCSPITKATCTPKRKAFAMTMKKHHGFHKKGEDGLAITPMEQYNGLNNSPLQSMIFPMTGDNLFRGLDNGQPVKLTDMKGKKVILKGAKDTAMMRGTVKEVKAQFGTKIKKDNSLVPNNYGLFNGVNMDGKNIDVPTNDQALETMIKYMLNNNSDQLVPNSKSSQMPSNTYRPQFQHHSTNTKEMLPIVANGSSISPSKAREILHDGTAHGKKITEKQRKFFGAMSNKKAQYGTTLQDEQLLKKKILDVQPIQTPVGQVPSQITIPDQAKNYKQDPKLSGSVVGQGKGGGGLGYSGQAAVGVGDVLSMGLGMANMLIGPDQPRRRVDNTLAYNPYPYGTGSQAIAAKGKNIPVRMESSELVTFKGGKAPKISENMFDGGTHMFTGNSHADGGIKSSFAGTGFEAEGGEPFAKIDNKGVVFGKLENPITGRTYKKDAKEIMKKELEVQDYLDKGVKLVNEKDPNDKFELLAFNSGTAMMKGAAAKQKQLAESKRHLADLQEAHLSLTGENGEKAQKGWSYQGTNTSNLDDKIKGFADLIKSKGYSGYSGAKGGVDNRLTKSGHPSRHIKGQALDMVLDTPNAYQTLLNDPEIASYALQNGLTLIDEYNPNISSKTGATAGHIHVGYDKGTSIADQFRTDASKLYPGVKPGRGIAPSSLTKGQTSYPVGDSYTETPQFKMPSYLVKDPIPGSPLPPPNSAASQPFEFQPVVPDKIKPTKDRLKLSQIMGEIPAIFDTPDFVQGQHYTPDLYTPYQVSFQDRINQNSKTFNALQGTLGQNPEALSVLAGQLYGANNSIQADEFRTNQGISNDITNKNVSLLNDAKLKNISLVDQQYVRQSQAKSITKQNRQNALNSISSKLLQKEASNNMLNVYKNLYPHYDFDKNYQVQKQGASGQEYINWSGVPDNSNTDSKTTTTYDASGAKKSTRVTTDPSYKREKGYLDLQQLKDKMLEDKFKTIKIDGKSIFSKKNKYGYGDNGLIVKKYKQF